MLLSIVIPCYNEEEVLSESINRLQLLHASLKSKYKEFDSELIFVNDGSKDRTLEILLSKHDEIPKIKVINFSRNFGHQIAVTAGMDAANGDAIVLIDSDLQDPPEVVEQMVELWHKGYDVIYATRTRRPGETKFKKLTAACFYRILNLLSDTPIPLDTGDFRLMDRAVVDCINAMPEKERFVRGMVSWVGFKQISLPYERAERFAGKSKYPLIKMLSFALIGILSFSIKPLKLASLLGIFSSLFAICGFIYVVYSKFIDGNVISGWTSLMLSLFFIGGVQLFCIGLLGEYIGRIYIGTKNRPLYVVDSYYGFDKINKTRSPVRKFK